MTHYLKIQETFADAVLSGEKSFEIRRNDRGYQKGDYVSFAVIDELKLPIRHPLEEELFEITYVLNGWGLDDDYVVFSIKRIKQEADNG